MAFWVWYFDFFLFYFIYCSPCCTLWLVFKGFILQSVLSWLIVPVRARQHLSPVSDDETLSDLTGQLPSCLGTVGLSLNAAYGQFLHTDTEFYFNHCSIYYFQKHKKP